MNHQWIKLDGNWKEGYAYDIHTISSIPVGQYENGRTKFDTTYTEMGKFIYLLKKHPSKLNLPKIVDLITSAKACFNFKEIDVIVSTPPSKIRILQPVFLIAEEFGKRLDIPVYFDFLVKTSGSEELKGMESDKRIEALKSTMCIKSNDDISGKNILLIDDLYRSGSTLLVATDLLYSQAKVKDVYVLTATKTRSNR
jgi:competence protein ComFC